MRGNNTMNVNRRGATLLELLIAVAVSAIVVTLACVVFIDLYKGFFLQMRRTEAIQETVTAKKQIEHCLLGIESIVQCSDNRLTCTLSGRDSASVIQFLHDSLCVNGKAACMKLAAFSFVFEKKSDGPWVLLWNARLAKGAWFGSAIGEGR